MNLLSNLGYVNVLFEEIRVKMSITSDFYYLQKVL